MTCQTAMRVGRNRTISLDSMVAVDTFPAKDGVPFSSIVAEGIPTEGKPHEISFEQETRNSWFLDSTAINLLPYNAPCPIPPSNAAISQHSVRFARQPSEHSISQLLPALSPARIDRRRRTAIRG